MLSDELPQLLQNLIVGVERTIERVSLNELQMPIATAAVAHKQLHANEQNKLNQLGMVQRSDVNATLLRNGNANHNNNSNNNNNSSSNNQCVPAAKMPNSPKCALKRSELITKNKTITQRYMLRRLTNRQDSINSNSSGNSCTSSSSAGSGVSATSAELQAQHTLQHKLPLQQQSTPTNGAQNVAEHTLRPHCSSATQSPLASPSPTPSPSTSPALPLFCLGNSFPHIDSDEENPDDKRNSMEITDAVNTEIIPPSSIMDIPEKLLTTGIYLPGTRDLKGHPIVTVEADTVVDAGLNCYEIATVLLYYTTIPECHVALQQHANGTQRPSAEHSKAVNCNGNAMDATVNGNVPNTTAITTTTQPAQQTFTIIITLERTQHLCVVDLICQSLKLLKRHVAYCEMLVVCLDACVLQYCKNHATTTTAAPLWRASDLLAQPEQAPQQQPWQLVKFIGIDEVTTSVAAAQVPHGKLQGLHHHDARKWREFFALLEPFQRQCASAGERLVVAMSDIRTADQQGLPTRRQLYAQHRALSRALMDSELHNLRKHGMAMLQCLQQLANSINCTNVGGDNAAKPQQQLTANAKQQAYSGYYTYAGNHQHNNQHSGFNNNNNNNNCNSNNNNNNSGNELPHKCANDAPMTSDNAKHNHNKNNNNNNNNKSTNAINNNNANNNNKHNDNISNNNYSSNNNNNGNNNDVTIKLNKVTLLFNEVDRAAKRLEQLTEQRREHLRELTRQRALEDEIVEVTTWITSDGNETLQRFAKLQLDSPNELKEHEQEFEKYYFISMKHLAKGRDLFAAAANMNVLRESSLNLKAALDAFTEKLEQTRERIEGAARLHHLVRQHSHDLELQQEMQRLAEAMGLKDFLDKHLQQHKQQQELLRTQMQQQPAREVTGARIKPNTLNLSANLNATTGSLKAYGNIYSSTPTSATGGKVNRSSYRSSSGNGSFDGPACHCWRESRSFEDMDEQLLGTAEEDEDGEEEQSKIADSGLGGCERCEGNPKLSRICSCQSLNETDNICEKRYACDEFDDECCQRPSKRYLDIHSPIEANTHLQCHASNLNLPKMEELSCLEPKIQKTLLLIMREMIGTERDYVRSLYYVIENYIDELLRDDIPQPLRGQRNVIFGNIEKIFEFHNAHFLSELERYEHNPLKVGAAFLQMESKFYLYALYNKNKPKSDTLMSEYGTAFFKPKQFELNDKMDLASYLLKPVQRMGKYALLLQQLVKACSTVKGSALQEIAADVEELQRAEEMVKFQLRHGNDLLAMDSLRDCDVNVKEQGRLLRQNEFLVSTGRGGKKTLRQVFLFEELVLFSKARRFPDHKNLDIYIYKNSIKTSDIGLTAHVGDSPTKFEIWFRKRKPEDTWTLQCMSEDIKNAWTEEISKLLWKQAKRNREIRLAEMSSMGIGSKPCLDIRPSNNQINDRSITITQLSKTPKLRHSFVGLHAEPNKSMRRPNSLISESSLSSGTSSSSISTGSSTGVPTERTASLNRSHNNSNTNQSSTDNSSNAIGSNQPNQCHVLELINETSTLNLHGGHHNESNTDSNTNGTNTLSSNGSSGVSVGHHMRNHKRSTTLVSQLSMESGIISDISITPDRELPDNIKSWSTATTPTGTALNFATTSATLSTANVIMRRHKNYKSEQHAALSPQQPQQHMTNESSAWQESLTTITITQTAAMSAGATAAPAAATQSTVSTASECQTPAKAAQAAHY